MLLSGPPPDSLSVYPVSVGGPVCGGTNIVLLSGPPPDSLRVYPVSVDVPISCCSPVRHLIQ